MLSACNSTELSLRTSQLRAGLPAHVDGWGVSLKGLMALVVLGGLLVAGTYFYLQVGNIPWTNNVISAACCCPGGPSLCVADPASSCLQCIDMAVPCCVSRTSRTETLVAPLWQLSSGWD